MNRLHTMLVALAAGVGIGSTAHSDFIEYFVVRTKITAGTQLLDRYELFVRFDGPTDTALNVFNLSYVGGSTAANPGAQFWHKDLASAGALTRGAGTWSPSQVGSSITNEPFDCYLLIGGVAGVANTTMADPSWNSLPGGLGWSQPTLPTSSNLGWLNPSPLNLQGRVGTPGNPQDAVALGQFVIDRDSSGGTWSLRIGYNAGPGTAAQFATSTFTLCKDIVWYADIDGDGFGSGAAGIASCTPIAGRVTNDLDCNDALVTYADADGDGFGFGAPVPCGLPNNLDCNDSSPTYADADGDGFGFGAPVPCGLPNDFDCNDALVTHADADGDGFGFGAPVPCGLPNNLDCNDALVTYADADGDGFGFGAPVPCGLPNNFDCDDSRPTYADADGDGVGSLQLVPCGGTPVSGDCDDQDPGSRPGLEEVCGDLRDNDCDLIVDDGCGAFDLALLEAQSSVPTPAGELVVYAVATAPAVPLAGSSMVLRYDTTRLEFIAAEPDPAGPFDGEIGEVVDPAAGTIRYGLISNALDAPMVGGGTLCRFRFRGTSGGCELPNLVAFTTIGPFRTRFVTAAAVEVLPANLIPLGAIDLDANPPEFVGAPGDATVAADAGSTTHATVEEPAVGAVDDCDAAPRIELLIDFPDGSSTGSWPADDRFPVGVSTLRWTATDAAGNHATVVRSLTVLATNLLDLSVTMRGSFGVPFTRTIRTSIPSAVATVTAGFQAGINPVTVVDGISIPATESVACIAVKDPVHSIAAVGSPTINASTRRWEAAVTLVQGDSNDDNMVEILDYGLWLADGFRTAAADARSNFNADGVVDSGDFSFIAVSFFSIGDSCAGAAAGNPPRERIRVKELRRLGYGEIAAFDLNQDGWFDLRDVQRAVWGAGRPEPAADPGVNW